MLHHACGKMGNIATTTKKIEKSWKMVKLFNSG
jgi:hypothetical protein